MKLYKLGLKTGEEIKSVEDWVDISMLPKNVIKDNFLLYERSKMTPHTWLSLLRFYCNFTMMDINKIIMINMARNSMNCPNSSEIKEFAEYYKKDIVINEGCVHILDKLKRMRTFYNNLKDNCVSGIITPSMKLVNEDINLGYYTKGVVLLSLKEAYRRNILLHDVKLLSDDEQEINYAKDVIYYSSMNLDSVNQLLEYINSKKEFLY